MAELFEGAKSTQGKEPPALTRREFLKTGITALGSVLLKPAVSSHESKKIPGLRIRQAIQDLNNLEDEITSVPLPSSRLDHDINNISPKPEKSGSTEIRSPELIWEEIRKYASDHPEFIAGFDGFTKLFEDDGVLHEYKDSFKLIASKYQMTVEISRMEKAKFLENFQNESKWNIDDLNLTVDMLIGRLKRGALRSREVNIDFQPLKLQWYWLGEPESILLAQDVNGKKEDIIQIEETATETMRITDEAFMMFMYTAFGDKAVDLVNTIKWDRNLREVIFPDGTKISPVGLAHLDGLVSMASWPAETLDLEVNRAVGMLEKGITLADTAIDDMYAYIRQYGASEELRVMLNSLSRESKRLHELVDFRISIMTDWYARVEILTLRHEMEHEICPLFSYYGQQMYTLAEQIELTKLVADFAENSPSGERNDVTKMPSHRLWTSAIDPVVDRVMDDNIPNFDFNTSDDRLASAVFKLLDPEFSVARVRIAQKEAYYKLVSDLTARFDRQLSKTDITYQKIQQEITVLLKDLG